MCVVKTPKVTPGSEKPKEPTIIRNPYLDGIDPATKALRRGRSSLRIERAGRGVTPVTPPATVPSPSSPVPPTGNIGRPGITPVPGGGGGGRFSPGRLVRQV